MRAWYKKGTQPFSRLQKVDGDATKRTKRGRNPFPATNPFSVEKGCVPFTSLYVEKGCVPFSLN
jgi:hypothetical protein